MTDPYADTDIWPNPPASQQPARPATLAASEPSRVVGEGSDAQEAREALSDAPNVPTEASRVAAYAEAIQSAYDLDTEVSVQEWDERVARAVMAVADAEQAGLRAEVERLRDEVKARITIGRLVKGAFDETWDERDAALAEVTGLRDRLGRAEALRDRWLAVDVPSAEVTSWSHYAGAALRAALAVPVTGDTEDASPAAEDGQPDQERGLYGKYRVERISDLTGKHDECRYFVLDPRHDPIARIALECYLESALSRGYQPLAADLSEWLTSVEESLPVPQIADVPRCQDCGIAWKPVRRGECFNCGSDSGPTGAASPTEQATEGGAK